MKNNIKYAYFENIARTTQRFTYYLYFSISLSTYRSMANSAQEQW